MLNLSDATWLASSAAYVRLQCRGAPCLNCAHLPNQQACIIDVELDAPIEVLNKSSCWPKCQFAKTSTPKVPDQCWLPKTPR